MEDEEKPPEGYYRDANGILKQKQATSSDQSHPNPALSEAEAKLMTDYDFRQLSRTSLVMMIDRNKGDIRALGAIREALDRIEGKPVQRILEKTQQVGDSGIMNLPIEFVN